LKTFFRKKRYVPQINDLQIIEMDNLIQTVSHATTQLKHEFQNIKIILFGSLPTKHGIVKILISIWQLMVCLQINILKHGENWIQ